MENVMRSPLRVFPSPNFSYAPNCTFYEWSRNPTQSSFFRIFSTIAVLTVLVVVVVLGNSLVIAAVLLRRRLRSATGLLILSLGVADLLASYSFVILEYSCSKKVGTVILPFSIANEVLSGYWIFGDTWCTVWLTMDIWMCTASIYNLVAISIDRYIAIIKPLNYPMMVTKFRARCIVAFVWILSFFICSPSFLLASVNKKVEDPNDACKCTPSHATGAYIVFSATSSFYLPMIVVIFVYVRIYIAARAATKSIYSGMMQVTANANKNAKNYLMSHPSALGSSQENVPMLRVHRGSSAAHNIMPDRNSRNRQNPCGHSNGASARLPPSYNEAISKKGFGDNESTHPPVKTTAKVITERKNQSSEPSPFSSPMHLKKGKTSPPKVKLTGDIPSQKESNARSMTGFGRFLRREKKKNTEGTYEKRLSLEIKAAKTVAIVTGCFIFCWLGFAILYGFSIETSPPVWSILFWLGYLNSALNPVIYTVFNREFRVCFKRLLTCHRVNNHPNTQKAYVNNNSHCSNTRLGTGAGYVKATPMSASAHVHQYSLETPSLPRPETIH